MQSALQPPERNSVGADSAVRTRYDKVSEMLVEFITYFVKESEAKFYSYHLVLEGELKKSGKFTEAFSKAVGYGVGGAVGFAGAYFGLFADGTKMLCKAGKATGKKLGDKIGSERYAKDVRQLSNLIKLSQKSKAAFRKMLVETGFDVFQSFEMQFMNVFVNQSSSEAMHVLAKDAINRAVNYLKKNESASIPEGVLLGESKRKDLESLSPGFSITYRNLSCKMTWNTANLYSKVGLLRIKDGEPQYFTKKGSNTGEHGYRRLFNQEKWDALAKVYVPDNIVESQSGHFTDYEYVLSLKDMKVKCEDILKKINSDDKNLAEDRIKELLEETKEDILEEINILKMQSHGLSEDLQRLDTIQASLENFCLEDHFKQLELFFREINEETAKFFAEHTEAVVQKIEKLSVDNKEQHGNTQAVLGRLNEGIKIVQKEQDRSKQTLKQIGDDVNNVNKNLNHLLRLQSRRDKDPIWFDMRESIEFTGRQGQLDQMVDYVQRGMIVITGLSGVGKSELAIKYARTHYNRDDNVIWINAKNRETVKHSFYRLYGRLGFKIDEESETQKDIAQDVYKQCSSKRSLFIFDDAEKYDTIKDVLPRGLPSNVIKPHVLITSACLVVKGGIPLPLGDFEIEESMDFIKKKISVKGNSQISEIRELAKKLHNFPIALQQAAASISEENKRLKNVDPEKEFTIKDYLEEFDKETEDHLKCEEFKNLGSDYDKTTFKAVQITLSKIRNPKYSRTALEILNIMAYFSTDNIPATFFLELANGDERKLGGSIQLLKDYSVVSGKGLLNIHGLVQKVITLELAKETEEGYVVEETVLCKALELLKKYMKDYLTIQNYVPHIISVWNYASKYDTLLDTFIVNYTDDCEIYTTYFHLIMQGSSYEVVAKVLQKIEENRPEELSRIINQKCNGGTTPLYCAAMSGDERKVKLLMNKGANIDIETKHKWNLLHAAARNGYQETVRNLLRTGININSQTEFKFTPLHLAAKGNHLEIVHLLLSEGADTTMQTARYFTPLHFAIIGGGVDIVETLLDNNTLSGKTRHEYTPLHLAAKSGQMEVFNVLLQRGADIHAKTRLKFTPLHFAANEGHLCIVEMLLNKNATVNVKDAKKFTPLHLAALKGHTDVVHTLLRHKADFTAETTKGNTPLHCASERGHLMVVKTLISNRANPNARNKEGKTPLDLAIEGNFVEIKDYINQQNIK